MKNMQVGDRFTNATAELRKVSAVVLSVVAFLGFTISAQANLVQNGDFETNAGPGQLTAHANGNNTNITSLAYWTNSGYNFLFTTGTAGSGVSSQFGTNDVGLWTSAGACPDCALPNGPGPDDIVASPNGGYFVGGDPSFQFGAITQEISGLVVGSKYRLSFYYAGAQQVSFTGPTDEGWQVSLGGSVFSTPLLDDASHGFTGWHPYSTTFTYSEGGNGNLLSFLAQGDPGASVPPFALLDGVSLSQTPEPAYLIPGAGMMALMVIGVLRLRKRAQA